MPREPRWARDGPSRRAPGAMMGRLTRRVSEANQVERSETRIQGARLFAYFWRGRPSGRLPKVSRRKGETQRSGVTAAGWPAGRAKRVNLWPKQHISGANKAHKKPAKLAAKAPPTG
ncbi:MAG: hypothetical protein CVV09_18605 [Gammaproteobacteria bacterium HGW-Gammaproteobacteria-13]|nr:MAG: hypothetical protein CVV09_18605 [Gammaproteobacteria bacterium HGW-Gammaproteobacteria-13]